MPAKPEQRRGADRRRSPRGGRRTSDLPGSTPLVLVADEDTHSRDTSETILAKLHFAVAPVGSVDEAIGVLSTLRPDVVVAHVTDVARLRNAIWHDGHAADVPLIILNDHLRDPDALVEEIRRALRARKTPNH
jgi:CheY-like chemotaxis protein